jgi:RimJ/RimL family protein N-acetyltransferase
VLIREIDSSVDDFASIAVTMRAADPDELVGPTELAEYISDLEHAEMRATWVIAEADGETIGAVCVSQSPWIADSTSLYIGVWVRPEHQRRGIGSDLFAAGMATGRSWGGRRLRGYVRGDVPAAVAFTEALGFERVDREWESEIDPQRFDSNRWQPLLADVAAAGIEITTIAAVREQAPDWFDRLHDLYSKVELDIPTVDEVQSTTAPFFRASAIDSVEAILEAFFVALDGDAWVGLTQLRSVDGDPTTLRQFLTGVAASHRRRGIATALKVVALEWARDHGYTRLRTENAESNQAMLAINHALGFADGRPLAEYHRKLDP